MRQIEQVSFAGAVALMVPAFACLFAVAADVDVGYREREEIRVPTGETVTQTGRVTVDGNGHLYKTGGGDLVIPAASVMQTQPLEIGVLGGVLALQSGGTRPSVAEPAVIRDEAAVWLDASSANLVTTNGTGYMERGTDLVKEWLDVRATDASDARYLHVAPNWWIGASGTHSLADGIPPCKVTAFGHTGLWFGGTNGLGQTSGQSLIFKTSAQSDTDRTQYTAVTNIFHVFVVHAVTNRWGYLLGTYHPTGGTTYRDYYSTGSLTSSILGSSYSCTGSSNTSRLFFDGVMTDPWTDSMSNHKGLHLMEFETTDRPGHFHALYCDATTNESYKHMRCGGDYLYELIVFTNKITDVERSRVRVHLMNKWGIPLSGAQSAKVDLAPGTTFTASTGAGETQSAEVTGSGTVVKTGAGKLVLPVLFGSDAFSGTVEVQGGSVTLQRDAVVTVADGDAVAVANEWTGDTVTKASGTAGTISKSGRGRLSLAAVPSATRKVSVSDGVLRFAPRAPVAATLVDSGVADPSDRSFESFTNNAAMKSTASNQGRVFASNGGYLGPWFYETLPNTYSPAMVAYNHYINVNHFAPWPAPDGVIVMYMKGSDCQGTADVTVPADGVYELSFYASSRESYQSATQRNHIDFYIGTNAESMVWFGNLVKSPSPYYRHFYRTPRLTGGRTYKLRFRSRDLRQDAATDFDDIRLRLVPDGELEPDVVKVPYGDFENVADLGPGTGGTHAPDLKGGTTAEGWSLTVENGSWSSDMLKPAAITTQGVTSYNRENGGDPYNRTWNCFYECGGPNVYGFAQLALISTGGVATTTATFTPPAGTYRLRADVARWTVVWDFNNENLSNQPQLNARVTCGSRGETSLGTLAFSHHALTPMTWPETFTVDGTENVTIALRQTRALSGALVDNLVLVPVRDLIVNGSFEDGTTLSSAGWASNVAGWTFVFHSDSGVAGYNSSAECDSFSRAPKDFGSDGVDGVIRLRLRGQGEVCQPIAFDAGYYRLRFFAESRHGLGKGPDGTFGMNPLRAYLTQGTATNMIGWTYVNSTNYVEHTFLFRVEEAGTYTFHLQGMSSPGTNWGWASGTSNDRMSLVDAVSILPVDAADVPTESGLSADATLEVAAGAKVELEFGGTNKLYGVSLGGRSVAGIISAETYPDYVSGPGVFEVQPKGTMIIFR